MCNLSHVCKICVRVNVSMYLARVHTHITNVLGASAAGGERCLSAGCTMEDWQHFAASGVFQGQWKSWLRPLTDADGNCWEALSGSGTCAPK